MVKKSESLPADRVMRTDGANTYVNILETAGTLFAANGFAKTSNKAIATQAGVDLASINYHFGNREGLYQAVLVEAHRRMVTLDDLQQLAQSNLPASARFEAVLRHLLHNILNHQGWHSRVLAQVLATENHNWELLQAEIWPKFTLMQATLSEISGIPPQEPALFSCLLNVMSPLLLLFLFGKQLPPPLAALAHMDQETLTQNIITFAQAGLQAVGENHRLQQI